MTPLTGFAPGLGSLRAGARHVALDALSVRERVGGRLEQSLAIPRVHLPYLHAVPEHEEDNFRALLTALAPTHTFISYSEALDRIANGPIDRPYVAFSFDDGFASNVRTAGILEEFGTTGMFFVPPGFIGVSTVSDARDFYGFSDGVDEPAMTWDDLDALKARGHEIGNHTLGHKVISWIDDEAVVEEIGVGADELRARYGDVTDFAWPRGRFQHFTQGGAATVFATGHLSCASAERGAHTVPAGELDRVCLRRDHLMTSWPLRHQLYFLARSAAQSSEASNDWPQDWHVG